MGCIIAFLPVRVRIFLPTSIEGSAARCDVERHALAVISFTKAGAMTDIHKRQDESSLQRRGAAKPKVAAPGVSSHQRLQP